MVWQWKRLLAINRTSGWRRPVALPLHANFHSSVHSCQPSGGKPSRRTRVAFRGRFRRTAGSRPCHVLSLNSSALLIATNSYDSGSTSERSTAASVRAPGNCTYGKDLDFTLIKVAALRDTIVQMDKLHRGVDVNGASWQLMLLNVWAAVNFCFLRSSRADQRNTDVLLQILFPCWPATQEPSFHDCGASSDFLADEGRKAAPGFFSLCWS